jgi:hypothetical protein
VPNQDELEAGTNHPFWQRLAMPGASSSLSN